jgi:soluble lytic murein transglycosylase-like protein
MPHLNRNRTLFAVAVGALGTCVLCAPVAAGELAAPEYRLKLDQPAALRLAGKEAVENKSADPSSEEVLAPLAERPYAAQIQSAAREAALDPALVHAVIAVESNYNPAARSPKGAIGLMQVLPETAQRYGVADPARSPEANLRAGTRYLSDLMQMFEGRLELVLAAYNAGEKAVQRHSLRIPPYPETQRYVPAVLTRYFEWRGPQPPHVETAPAQPARIVYLSGTVLDIDGLRRRAATEAPGGSANNP